jgi:HAD superfamily hydrolase (TIGR01484 family)
MKKFRPSRRFPAPLEKKEIIIFDLDGTLTPSKSPLKPDMASALRALLKEKKVAVIGGGSYPQFRRQFITRLKCPPALLRNLFLFPVTATSFYRYKHGWGKIYALKFSKKERAKIKKAFREVFKEINYAPPARTYGEVIEDRGTQITFSALGQDVVAMLGEKKGLQLKEQWKKKYTPLKFKIAKLLAKKLPDFEVRPSAFTSIDVTQKGIDKSYGVRQIKNRLHVPIKNMLFVGDALFPNGNDYAAKRTGVLCVAVRGPEDTKKVIKKILEN